MNKPSKIWHGKIVAGPNGCCIFTGGLTAGGYGQISKDGKQKYAHRVMYEECWGPIPTGLNVLHRCSVRRCVNPLHLYVGNQKQNMEDRRASGYVHSEEWKKHMSETLTGRKVSLETRAKMRAAKLKK